MRFLGLVCDSRAGPEGGGGGNVAHRQGFIGLTSFKVWDFFGGVEEHYEDSGGAAL